MSRDRHTDTENKLKITKAERVGRDNSKFKCLFPNPIPYNVTVLRDTVFKEVIKSKWGHSVALIQFRCPCNQRKLRHRQIQNTQGTDHPLWDKGKPQKSTCWPLDLGLAAARTERKQISVYATQPMPLCYSSPINRKTSEQIRFFGLFAVPNWHFTYYISFSNAHSSHFWNWYSQ